MHTLVLLARVVYLPLRGVLYLSTSSYLSIYIYIYNTATLASMLVCIVRLVFYIMQLNPLARRRKADSFPFFAPQTTSQACRPRQVRLARAAAHPQASPYQPFYIIGKDNKI